MSPHYVPAKKCFDLRLTKVTNGPRPLNLHDERLPPLNHRRWLLVSVRYLQAHDLKTVHEGQNEKKNGPTAQHTVHKIRESIKVVPAIHTQLTLSLRNLSPTNTRQAKK